MEVLIELQGIWLGNQGYQMLQDINLRLPNGKSTYILGPTGSGKSTLLQVVAGLELPDEGEVRVMGRRYRDMSHREQQLYREGACFVFQDGALWANQTVYTNIRMPLRFHRPELTDSEADEMIRQSLATVGFDEATDQRPVNLSAGEQKLVAIARALVLDPHLLFLDEPTSFIDESGERRIIGLLEGLRRRGKTVVAVTNFYHLAFRLADYLCIMQKGKLHCMDRTERVVASWPSFMQPIEPRHQRLLERRFGTGVVQQEQEA
jgi:phospholipid/cholesterol/gamma-HCH transport system ATP-binding protein